MKLDTNHDRPIYDEDGAIEYDDDDDDDPVDESLADEQQGMTEAEAIDQAIAEHVKGKS